MKRIIILLVFSIPLLLLAQSPEKLIADGKYDQAIEKSVDRLEKDRGDKTDLYAALKKAYETANERDISKIKELKATGKPDIWYDVFKLYYAIDQRHEMVYPIKDKLEADRVNIQLIEYPQDQKVARDNAAAYLYAHAMSKLESDEPGDAVEAYGELLKITRIFKEYKDVELQMRHALAKFGDVALLEVKNTSDAALSPDFLSGMEEIPLTVREKAFLDYIAKSAPGDQYPLFLKIEIQEVKVSPGTVSEKEYTASHKEPEIFDSAYEDEKQKEEAKKHPDYNKCSITEIYQLKTAMMKGQLKYIDGTTNKILYVVPILAQARFENKTASASGDMFACPPEVQEILDKPKKKFPENTDMLIEVSEEFKLLVKSTVWNERFLAR
jgi:hypothetical protein